MPLPWIVHRAPPLAITEKVYGPNHPEVAIRLNNLGPRPTGPLVTFTAAKMHPLNGLLAIDENVYRLC